MEDVHYLGVPSYAPALVPGPSSVGSLAVDSEGDGCLGGASLAKAAAQGAAVLEGKASG